jgi:4Fe-4S ferredoxin
MPLKTQKSDTAQALTLEWILQVKNFKLTLDKNRCVGCQICSLACPKNAITVTKQSKTAGEPAKKAKVDIDLAKCNFCGLCDITCPYGAVKVALNGEHILNVIGKDCFPTLVRDIKVDASLCPPDCVVCQEACPLGVVRVSKSAPGEGPVRVNVAFSKEHCPTCRACEYKCPSGALKMHKAFEGKLAIDPSKCPDGCHDCVDVCPIKGTLTISGNGKVEVNESTCTYCGACKGVCPVNEALTLKRTKILHTPIHSGAWNMALERLASPVEAVKELKAKSGFNARNAVRKRFEQEKISQ